MIDRVCARCGAEYEWGVHVTAFAESAGFTAAQTRAIGYVCRATRVPLERWGARFAS